MLRLAGTGVEDEQKLLESQLLVVPCGPDPAVGAGVEVVGTLVGMLGVVGG